MVVSMSLFATSHRTGAGVLDEPDSAKPAQCSSHTGPPGYIGWTVDTVPAYMKTSGPVPPSGISWLSGSSKTPATGLMLCVFGRHNATVARDLRLGHYRRVAKHTALPLRRDDQGRVERNFYRRVRGCRKLLRLPIWLDIRKGLGHLIHTILSSVLTQGWVGWV